MNCDKCKNYIYSNDWFPENDFKICKQCFENSDKSAPNTKRFINHFDLDNSMSDIENEMKENVIGRATQKAYHDLNDISIENLENPKRTIMLHEMIQELIKTADLNDHDSITLFKQLTLNAIYITVENTIESMEKNSIESFQEEFK
tara:strand:+ start:901 stop:1338 length:438 start_codon:yes stop_codon:yes gene_type:complete